MHIVVTGGGTGGHIYPAIAVAQYALRHVPGTTVQFIGSSAGPECRAAMSAGIPFEGVDVAGVVGKSPVKAAKAIFKFLRASRECRVLLKESFAGCVLGTGGYASAPACYAATRLKIPLVIHEMNYEPGLVTRMFSKRASRVALAYEGTADLLPEGAVTSVTGVPVRPEIEALASLDGRARSRDEALGELGLEDGRKTLLVFGGSQGAEALNGAIWGALPGIASRGDLQVLHLVGRRNFGSRELADARKAAGDGELIYRPYDYMERMELAYAVADVALSRAGAGTIAELMAIGLPAVLVPFPYATGGHQEKNARAMARTGAVAVALQKDGSAREAVELALDVVSNREALDAMRRSAESATRADGAKGIASLIEEVT